MKSSRGDTMSQTSKTFFKLALLLYYITFRTTLRLTTNKGHLSNLIYYIWQHRIRLNLQ